ncbi:MULTISPECIES: hypothetical protein [Aerosakkonema]|uniref:hypothetical protein n=1 Tax=Aerosakkonema TaxID=1246629 RepID=UPI0035B776BB
MVTLKEAKDSQVSVFSLKLLRLSPRYTTFMADFFKVGKKTDAISDRHPLPTLFFL